MYLLKKSYSAIFAFSFFCSSSSIAQDMNSPYSAYGIGNIDMQQYNMNSGMGYTGIGLKSTYFSSGNNAASISGLPRSVLVVDINAVGQISTYHGTPINLDNSVNRDFTIKGVSLADRINNFWASGIGFRQFSVVNYQFTSKNFIEGSANSYTSNFTGEGGLNEYFWNNAFNIGKHLAAGIKMSFISGPITQTESVTAYNQDIESKRRDYYGNFRFEYGLIYNTDPKKNHIVSFGFNYAPESKLNYERSLSVTNNSVQILNNDYLNYSLNNLPAFYGAGFALKNNNGATFAADYSFQNWSKLNKKGNAWQLVDANRISIGADFARSGQRGGKTIHPKSFQFGAHLSNSYLQLNGRQINEFGFTAGIKSPVKNSLLISAALEAGSRGTTQAKLIQESFVKLSLSFSLREFIYKGKIYY